jgi:transposase-like protein
MAPPISAHRIVRLWTSSWAEFVPFLEYDMEIRRGICTTNAIESINPLPKSGEGPAGTF